MRLLWFVEANFTLFFEVSNDAIHSIEMIKVQVAHDTTRFIYPTNIHPNIRLSQILNFDRTIHRSNKNDELHSEIELRFEKFAVCLGHINKFKVFFSIFNNFNRDVYADVCVYNVDGICKHIQSVLVNRARAHTPNELQCVGYNLKTMKSIIKSSANVSVQYWCKRKTRLTKNSREREMPGRFEGIHNCCRIDINTTTTTANTRERFIYKQIRTD